MHPPRNRVISIANIISVDQNCTHYDEKFINNRIQWVHQYSLDTSFGGFRCLGDPWNIMVNEIRNVAKTW